ncbi:unnamed protein product, partial [marine sediment metagenome]
MGNLGSGFNDFTKLLISFFIIMMIVGTITFVSGQTSPLAILGDDIIYYLEISTDNNFVTVDYANTTITETDLSGRTEDNVSLADGDYYWRVLAYDIEGNSSWSDVFAFNLSNPFVPSTPQIYPSATDHNFSFNGICENSSDIDS